jgi:hypothetical protein
MERRIRSSSPEGRLRDILERTRGEARPIRSPRSGQKISLEPTRWPTLKTEPKGGGWIGTTKTAEIWTRAVVERPQRIQVGVQYMIVGTVLFAAKSTDNDIT